MLLALACSGSRKGLEEACLREPSLIEGVTVEEDTALHVGASYGDSANFLKCADFIFGNAKDLLFVRNNNRDTPLHCAVRAGNPHMIYRLIGFAKSVGRTKELLEMENKLGETALHEAVRIQNNGIVKQLMEEDPELANIPRDGASPLYLAVLFEDKTIAETLYAKSTTGMLSYSGPNGQNALHAAVLRGEVMTELLLNWKKDLTTQADQNGSTPLHIAASLIAVGGGFYCTFSRTFPWVFIKWRSGVPIKPLVRADPYQLYQPDNEGLFPIHIAAASGLYSTVMTMITEYPEIAGLRDSKGKTFIHVATEWKRGYFVENACRTPSLAWILNMRDNDGNTALHLAIQLGVSYICCFLMMNKKVRLDLTNNNGESPLDITCSQIPTEYSYMWNSGTFISATLKHCQARYGYHLRYDKLKVQYLRKTKQEEVNESDKLTNSTQTLIIGPVLIATVTFGASITMPGGYNNGGMPELAGRYIFDAFMMANTIAFLLSAAATIDLMYAGTAMVDLRIRGRRFNIAAYCTFCSVTSLCAAFALGQYLILAHVAHMRAIAICALVFLMSWFGYMEPLRGNGFARALRVRQGRSKAFFTCTRIMFWHTLVVYWPLVIIFGSAAISSKYGHKQMA